VFEARLFDLLLRTSRIAIARRDMAEDQQDQIRLPKQAGNSRRMLFFPVAV
jgi:hypothetical protein